MAEMVQLRQGPWTDLYALGAVIHFLLFGAPPSPATARAVHDDALDLELRKVPGVSAEQFQQLAENAKNGCPISKALKAVPMTLAARLA